MSDLSLFHVIAHDDQDDAIRHRKVAVASKQRLDARYAQWLAYPESFDERWAYVEDEARQIVAATIEEFGASVDADYVLSAYKAGCPAVKAQATYRQASTIHEARKPRMCPFHKDVTDISLAAGDPRAGFDSMAQHWGGPRHCEGEGYKGESCKFRPEMTTQSYWDERAEKLQQQRDEKQQREVEQQEQEVVEQDQVEGEPDVVSVPSESEREERTYEELAEGPDQDGAHEIDDETGGDALPHGPTHSEGELVHAAKTAAPGPVPTMDKRKWTPREFDQPLPVDDPNGPNPTRHQDILEPVKPQNADVRHPRQLEGIGEQVTEHQDVTEDTNPSESARAQQGGTFSSFLSAEEVAEAIKRHKS